MLIQVSENSRRLAPLGIPPPLHHRLDFSIMFAATRRAGQVDGSHPKSNNRTHRSWPLKLLGFQREVGSTDGERKMKTDRKKCLRFMAKKERILKTPESESRDGGGNNTSGDLSNGPWQHHNTKQPIVTQEVHEQTDVDSGGHNCVPEASLAKWSWSLGREEKHCLFVKGDRCGECCFVDSHRQTHTLPTLRKCPPALAAQFKGQENCRGPVCGQREQQGDCVRELLQGVPHGADKLHTDIPCGKPMSERQQQKHQQSSSQMGQNTAGSETLDKLPPSKGTTQRRPNGPGPCQPWSRKKQRAVQDQICRVVVELEGILHGLKEVHLEMKEVVQQIELLTSAIDLEGDEAIAGLHSDTVGCSSSSGVVMGRKVNGVDSKEIELGVVNSACSSQKSALSETCTPLSTYTKRQTSGNSSEITCTPKHEPLHNTQTSDRNVTKVEMKSTIIRTTTRGPKGKKPPPYPHHCAKIVKTEKGRDCPKAPPYPVKRRLLSTTV